jgi:hypothetical protein
MKLRPQFLALAALACTGSDNEETSSVGACDSQLRSWTATDESDGDAIVEVEVESDGSLRSALVSVTSADGDNLVLLYEIEDPDGEIQFFAEDWWYSNQILTMAPFPYFITSNGAWPVIPDADGAMAEGTWLFRFQTLTNWNYANDAKEPVEIVVHENARTETSRCVHVRFVLADGLPDNEPLMDDLEKAVAVFEGILIRHDIALHATWYESDLDPVLPSPSDGSSLINDLVEDSPEDTLNVIIGETVEVMTEGLAGESGGIPGALHATEHSAVVIAWLELAGISGSLEDDEVQMLGETIAHEVGHYAGLVHPVQFDDDLNIVAWDALDDTSNCQTVDGCLEKLASNVMFPYLLCDWTNLCDSQDEVSDQQASVFRTYAGIR